MKTPTEDKVAYLLYYVGEKAYNEICDNLGKDDPYFKNYDEKIKKFGEMYAPTKLEVAEKYKFNCRVQRPDEGVQEFANAITKLSTSCEFTADLSKALRNQFVFGMDNRRIQQRLLETADLTFDKALKTAIAMELSEKEAKNLHKNSAEVEYLHANKMVHRKQNNKKVVHKGTAQLQKSVQANNNNTDFKSYNSGYSKNHNIE